jgi:hypothetical protein
MFYEFSLPSKADEVPTGPDWPAADASAKPGRGAGIKKT